MRASTVVGIVLTVAVLAAGVAMFLTDNRGPGWVLIGFGLFGYILLLGMVAADARAARPGP